MLGRYWLLVCLVVAAVGGAASLGYGGEAAWQELFNKQDLTGWQAGEGNTDTWFVEKGVLKCNGKPGGWLATTQEYGDFELEVEFRTVPGANSGIFLRSPLGPLPTFHGMEIQVLDDYAAKHKNIKPWQRSGSLYGIAAAKTQAAKAPGDWQLMIIRCQGPHVAVELNGYKIVDADLTTAQPVDGDKHPGMARRSGHIGLQNHATPIEYRALRLRSL